VWHFNQNLARGTVSATANLLTALGLPPVAMVTMRWIVYQARTWESQANPAILKQVSDLLLRGNLANAGKLVVTLVPIIFDRIFGANPFRLKFIWRSILVTTLFWLILLLLKHPDWGAVWGDLLDNTRADAITIFPWYVFDWLSLIKARLLLRTMAKYGSFFALLLFVLVDVFISAAIPAVLIDIMNYQSPLISFDISQLWTIILGNYLTLDSSSITLPEVLYPTTLLTSLWTVLLLISTVTVKLLVPVDRIRGFIRLWFRDIDRHPLSAIAKVMEAIVVGGAVAVSGIRAMS
jgi:hypothetical protein